MRAMKALAIGGFAALAMAGAAMAGTMENTYANTVVTTSSTGEVSSFQFNADGTYAVAATTAEGQAVAATGTWALKADKVCVLPNAVEGQPAPTETCADYVDGKNVGDTWTIKNSEGETLSVTIVAGR